MLPSMPMGGGGKNSRLLALYQRLPSEDQQTLMAFAEFLQQRATIQKESEPQELQLPGNSERPQQESVVAAIRRLSNCYPMLEKETLLHETSELMSSHVLKGKAAIEVIDDLEALFSTRYDEYRKQLEQD
ncbi:MAG TPA: hypothetical protein DDW45_06210 [Gammaproteobacteria bacterium]|nr:hypothetical protein [Gammaproteobacteria bacterium]